MTIPATGHSYGDWKETKAPSANEEGERERECSHCGKTQTEKLPVIPTQYTPPLFLFAVVLLLILAMILYIIFKD